MQQKQQGAEADLAEHEAKAFRIASHRYLDSAGRSSVAEGVFEGFGEFVSSRLADGVFHCILLPTLRALDPPSVGVVVGSRFDFYKAIATKELSDFLAHLDGS